MILMMTFASVESLGILIKKRHEANVLLSLFIYFIIFILSFMNFILRKFLRYNIR